MEPTAPQKDVEVASLKTHPRQHDFFPVATEAELDELAADLESRGQQEPIHCTADGTLIRGHRRVECVKRLGWETIRAIVHDEITDLPVRNPLRNNTLLVSNA